MTAIHTQVRSGHRPDPEWASRGACRDVDPETLFVVGAAQHKAKAICLGCPVRIDCLADALDSRAEFGVWGGMTERERRALLRRRPDVRSWRQFLEAAKEKYEKDVLIGGDADCDLRPSATMNSAINAAAMNSGAMTGGSLNGRPGIPRQRDQASSFGRA